MCPIFNWKNKKKANALAEKDLSEEDPGDLMEENISTLARQSSGRELDEVVTEVEESIKQASRSSLKELSMQAAGRCPDCGKGIQTFVRTKLCLNCGWASFITPGSGRTVVHTLNGQAVECDQAFTIRDGDVLCLAEGFVVQLVPKHNVSSIEYAWTDEERARQRRQAENEKRSVCGWCQKEIGQEDETFVDYVAFGTFQNRYMFCSEDCQDAFRKHYPSRIHRNCYETDCEECDLCVKRYENAQNELRTYSGLMKVSEDAAQTAVKEDQG